MSVLLELIALILMWLFVEMSALAIGIVCLAMWAWERMRKRWVRKNECGQRAARTRS